MQFLPGGGGVATKPVGQQRAGIRPVGGRLILQLLHETGLVRVTDRVAAGGVITQEVTFTYDGLNRRIAKAVADSGPVLPSTEVAYFVYDREDVILDFVDSDGVAGTGAAVLVLRYLHGPGADMVLAQEYASGGVRWLLTDHLGTTRDIVGHAGALLNHIKYDSFGNIVSQSNAADSTRYLFTGREYEAELASDSGGFYYYRARFYDPSIGKFIQRDPLGFADGTNYYEYVGSNPIGFTDPTGQFLLPIVVDPGLYGLPGRASTVPAPRVFDASAFAWFVGWTEYTILKPGDRIINTSIGDIVATSGNLENGDPDYEFGKFILNELGFQLAKTENGVYWGRFSTRSHGHSVNAPGFAPYPFVSAINFSFIQDFERGVRNVDNDPGRVLDFVVTLYHEVNGHNAGNTTAHSAWFYQRYHNNVKARGEALAPTNNPCEERKTYIELAIEKYRKLHGKP